MVTQSINPGYFFLLTALLKYNLYFLYARVPSTRDGRQKEGELPSRKPAPTWWQKRLRWGQLWEAQRRPSLQGGGLTPWRATRWFLLSMYICSYLEYLIWKKKKGPDAGSHSSWPRASNSVTLGNELSLTVASNLPWMSKSDFDHVSFIFNVLFKELILHSGCNNASSTNTRMVL